METKWLNKNQNRPLSHILGHPMSAFWSTEWVGRVKYHVTRLHMEDRNITIYQAHLCKRTTFDGNYQQSFNNLFLRVYAADNHLKTRCTKYCWYVTSREITVNVFNNNHLKMIPMGNTSPLQIS